MSSLGIQKALTWEDGSTDNPNCSFCLYQGYTTLYLFEKHIYVFYSWIILWTSVISEEYEL